MTTTKKEYREDEKIFLRAIGDLPKEVDPIEQIQGRLDARDDVVDDWFNSQQQKIDYKQDQIDELKKKVVYLEEQISQLWDRFNNL